MSVYKYLYIPFLLFVFVSCLGKREVNVSCNVEKIYANGQLEFDFDKAFAFSHYTKLETNSNCLISHIIKIVFTDKIFIQDYNSKIFIFNMKGEYLNKIDFKGNAPEEYSSISDFVVNDSLITITDTNAKNAVSYHLDGHFVKKEKMPMEILYNEKIGEYDLWYTGNVGCDLNYSKSNKKFHKLVFAKDLSVISMFSPFGAESNGYVYRTTSPFYEYNNKHFFIEPINDTIYSIKEETIVPEYVVDFGKYNRPINFIEETAPENLYNEMAKSNYVKAMVSYYDFAGLIYFNAFIGKEYKHVLYDKRKKQSVMTSVILDSKNKLPVEPIAYTGEKEYLVSVLRAEKILASNNNELNLEIAEEDNPVLFFYKYQP